MNQPNYSYPYKGGAVSNWEELEALWENCFTSLKVEPSGADVFLTEPHQPNKLNREKTVETMFELFDVGATYLHTQPVLALFAAGLTTGCVVDSGEYSTSVYPVAEGYHLDNCSIKLPYGGAQITEILTRLMLDKGYGPHFGENPSSHNSLTELKLRIVRAIKERLAYVDTEPKASSDILPELIKLSGRREVSPRFEVPAIAHILPDGHEVIFEDELHSCTEKFFQPRLFDQMLACEADEPLQRAVFKSIMNCGVDIRKNLMNNIVLAGGSTTFKGFEKRFTTELKQIVPTGMSSSVRVKNIPDRSNAIWIGGSIIAGMSTFDEKWITAQDYDEFGSNIVHEKCPIYL